MVTTVFPSPSSFAIRSAALPVQVDEAGAQLDLLSGDLDRKRERLEKLEGAMDSIRSKYGKGAISPASAPLDPGADRHAPPPGGVKSYLENS